MSEVARSTGDRSHRRRAGPSSGQTTSANHPARRARSKQHRHWGSSIRLQALRLLLWNHAGADPIKAAEALIKSRRGRRDYWPTIATGWVEHILNQKRLMAGF